MFDQLPAFLATAAPTTQPVASGASPDGSVTTAQPATQPGGPTTPPPSGGNSSYFQIIFLVVMMILIFWMFTSGPRKEKKKREALLASMKKGDKVLTIGGLIATVVEIRDSEVVLKVDETNNTRMRFSKSAIQSVIADSQEEEKK